MFGPSSLTHSEAWRQRTAQDREILAARMPRLAHLMMMRAEEAVAIGEVEVDAGAGRFLPVSLEIWFRPGYPRLAPEVWEKGGRWRPEPDRHMYPSGKFCLGLPGVDMPATDTPEEFDYFLKQLLVFLHDQFLFDATGAWPGPEWPHGDDAYAEFAIDTLGITTPEEARRLGPLLQGPRPRRDQRCPCGRRLPYRACHRARVELVRSVEFVEQVPNLTERMVGRLYVA